MGGGRGDGLHSFDDDFDSEAYLDAADRLERAMDTQIQILEGIDSKAEHVTRLVAILLGILFSVISFVTQLRQAPTTSPPFPVFASFAIGVGSLLVSMGAAIVTYLSSQYKIGLHEDVGDVLSDASYSAALAEHIRSVLGTYPFVLGQNRRVIEANVFWFRVTLLFLLFGVLFVSLSGFFYVGGVRDSLARNGLLAAFGLSFTIGYYVLSGSFLPLRDEHDGNERTRGEEVDLGEQGRGGN